tara:strand:- start:94 stop:435 length:342 start_codon:yes stop_codon:yes gene_type:complete
MVTVSSMIPVATIAISSSVSVIWSVSHHGSMSVAPVLMNDRSLMVVDGSHNRSWVVTMNNTHNRRRRVNNPHSGPLWDNQNITRWEMSNTSRGKHKNQCQEKNFILHNQTPLL